MAKTDLTKTLERQIWDATQKQGVFGCFEVTMGWFGNERVDYITYDTKDVWRCYEIKVSKADFYSKAKVTFVGHYNYYVMTKELYEQVKDDIPKGVGVYIGSDEYRIAVSKKRAQKQELGVDEQVLKDSLIRSLYRDAVKVAKSADVEYVNSLKRKLSKMQKDIDLWEKRYWDTRYRLMEEQHKNK